VRAVAGNFQSAAALAVAAVPIRKRSKKIRSKRNVLIVMDRTWV
jgi:hypothetical protein